MKKHDLTQDASPPLSHTSPLACAASVSWVTVVSILGAYPLLAISVFWMSTAFEFMATLSEKSHMPAILASCARVGAYICVIAGSIVDHGIHFDAHAISHILMLAGSTYVAWTNVSTIRGATRAIQPCVILETAVHIFGAFFQPAYWILVGADGSHLFASVRRIASHSS